MNIIKNRFSFLLIALTLFGCFQKEKKSINNHFLKGKEKIHVNSLTGAIQTSNILLAKINIKKIRKELGIQGCIELLNNYRMFTSDQMPISFLILSVRVAAENISGQRERNAIEIVKLLLDSGADPNTTIEGLPFNIGNNVVMQTIQQAVPEAFKTELLEYFAEHGANFNIECGYRKDDAIVIKYSALSESLFKKELRVSETLVKHGADVNFIYYDGSSLLYLMTKKLDVESVIFLLSKGAVVTLPYHLYFTIINMFHPALIEKQSFKLEEEPKLGKDLSKKEKLAAIKEVFKVIEENSNGMLLQKLLIHGGIVDKFDQVKAAVDRRYREAIIEGLLRQRVDVIDSLNLFEQQIDYSLMFNSFIKGRHIFHFLARIKELSILNYFWDVFGLSQTFKTNELLTLDIDQTTPLILAARYGNMVFMRNYLNLENVLIGDVNKINVFNYFVLKNEPEVVCQFLGLLKMLAGQDMDKLCEIVNSIDIKGNTILHRLAVEGNLIKLELLLSLGIKLDFMKKNEAGATALSYAEKKQHHAMVERLKKVMDC